MTPKTRLGIGIGLGLALGAGLAGHPASRHAIASFLSERTVAAESARTDEGNAGAEPAGGSDSPDRATDGSRETSSGRSRPLPVAGFEVSLGPFVLSVRASGRAEAPRRVELSARVGERVASVSVTEGDRVRRGDELLALDARPYELAQREAAARKANAEVDYQMRVLGDTAAVDSEGALTRANAAANRAGLTEAQLQLERAELDLASTRLRAPFDGVVASVDAVVGQNVSPNEPVVTIVDLATIRIPAEVLESDFGHLVPGAPARVRFAAFPDDTFTATVTALSPECDPESGTGVAYIELPNVDGRIRPGMYAEVEIEAARHEDRLAVPRRAILERDRKLLVFRASKGRAEWQYVSTGLENEHEVEVTEGLAPGDTVLVDGHFTIAHGAPVKVTLVDAAK